MILVCCQTLSHTVVDAVDLTDYIQLQENYSHATLSTWGVIFTSGSGLAVSRYITCTFQKVQ